MPTRTPAPTARSGIRPELAPLEFLRDARSPQGFALTAFVIAVLRTNTRLITAGDDLTRDLGLSSARWQVMSTLRDSSLTVAAIARILGYSRQGVQTLINALIADGLVAAVDNPHNRRVKLMRMTRRGHLADRQALQRQAGWVERLATGIAPETIDVAATMLWTLYDRLAEDALLGHRRD